MCVKDVDVGIGIDGDFRSRLIRVCRVTSSIPINLTTFRLVLDLSKSQFNVSHKKKKTDVLFPCSSYVKLKTCY